MCVQVGDVCGASGAVMDAASESSNRQRGGLEGGKRAAIKREGRGEGGNRQTRGRV